jgi:enterochelin esterase family protein
MRFTLAFTLAAVAFAQAPATPPPAPIRSPEVSSDRRVTFRLRAPKATEVLVDREFSKRTPMTKGDDGVWTLTTDPLPAEIYGYRFVVDGTPFIDPVNRMMKTNLLGSTSAVQVPGTESWDERDVPHGALTEVFYESKIAGDRRSYFVYTPPGYDARAGKKYPVLYLLHGFSDGSDGWSVVGRAHVILDNLVADKKAVPMVVVMPLGYGEPAILRGPRTPDMGRTNVTKHKETLLQEVIPQVEKNYRVETKQSERAIAGLSMGGGESLYSGLTAPYHFAYVASFSGAVPEQAMIDGLDESINKKVKLLWIACGKDDFLIKRNTAFIDLLKEKKIKHVWNETEGAHTWAVWRRNLTVFTPMLFR